jgi:hypothetical protein
MYTVPAGKIIYIGGRRFIEGESIPPHLAVKMQFAQPEKPKRGRPSLSLKSQEDPE